MLDEAALLEPASEELASEESAAEELVSFESASLEPASLEPATLLGAETEEDTVLEEAGVEEELSLPQATRPSARVRARAPRVTHYTGWLCEKCVKKIATFLHGLVTLSSSSGYAK